MEVPNFFAKSEETDKIVCVPPFVALFSQLNNIHIQLFALHIHKAALAAFALPLELRKT